jgi:hypothetical protein
MAVVTDLLRAEVAVVSQGDDDGNFKVRVDLYLGEQLVSVHGQAGLSHGDAVAKAASAAEALDTLGIPHE